MSLPTFISTWNTENLSTGSSATKQIKLPLNSGGTYNFIANWGDSTTSIITSWNQVEVTHTYTSTGTYTIQLDGVINGWKFGYNKNDNLKIIDISQWGNLLIGDDGYQFYNCSNMTCTATDILYIGNNITNMFNGCSHFNSNLNSWNVSNVTNMSNVFVGCTIFNSNLSSWNVSNVTNMTAMFYGCSVFNSDLSSWNVGNVTDMNYMFFNCSVFNSNISSWNVSNVTNFSTMFYGCSIFNQDLSLWNVSNVLDTNNMFNGCKVFNSNLNFWNVSNVYNMSNMFNGCNLFNSNLNSWNVSNVNNMNYMFTNCSIFNQDLSLWDVSKVTSMYMMFFACKVFNQNINSWNVSNVNNMNYMFSTCYAFNQNLNSWDVGKVTDMSGMFSNCLIFNQNLNSWNVGNVTNMSYMFNGCSKFNSDISSWNVGKVTDMHYMFFSCYSFNSNISSWNVGNVITFNMMFFYCSVFNQDLSSWNVSKATNMYYMFDNCSKFNQDLSSWNVSNVSTMEGMFYMCSSFNSNLGTWNISNVTNMNYMLYQTSLSLINYSLMLNFWSHQIVKHNVTLVATPAIYAQATVTSRNKLILSPNFWNIIDGGMVNKKSGYKGWTTLEQYDLSTGLPTGIVKPNSINDSDYIYPVQDLIACPIPITTTTTTRFTTTTPTTTTTTTIGVPGFYDCGYGCMWYPDGAFCLPCSPFPVTTTTTTNVVSACELICSIICNIITTTTTTTVIPLRITNVVTNCINSSIVVTISNGTGPFRYSSDNGKTLTAPTNNTTYTFNNLIGGVYDIYVQDSIGNYYNWEEQNCNQITVTFEPVYLTQNSSGYIYDENLVPHTDSFNVTRDKLSLYNTSTLAINGSTFLGWSFSKPTKSQLNQVQYLTKLNNYQHIFNYNTTVYAIFDKQSSASLIFCFIPTALGYIATDVDMEYYCANCIQTMTVYFNESQFNTLGYETITWYKDSALTLTVDPGYYKLYNSNNSTIYRLANETPIIFGNCGVSRLICE